MADDQVALIQDEDILRKMWQETEDFTRKREIRSHMSKLREQRLKNFYSSEEITRDLQRTNSSPGFRESSDKSCKITHADSLGDHSFLSLKSKEIRDSESPTRDINFKKTTGQGWNVVATNEKSDDGKTFTTTRLATTAGTEKLDNGIATYAAKNEMKSSVRTDGDDKNFSKSVGASSTSVIKQEAFGGDETSKFTASSTSTSSSSRLVTEHRSTTDDISCRDAQRDASLISKQVYTDNVPDDLKKHPSYVEGKTKVTTEIKTLDDGTIVKTTRYETKGDRVVSKQQSSSSKQQSSSSSMQTSQDSSSRRTNVEDVGRYELIPATKETSSATRTRTNQSETGKVVKGSVDVSVTVTGEQRSRTTKTDDVCFDSNIKNIQESKTTTVDRTSERSIENQNRSISETKGVDTQYQSAKEIKSVDTKKDISDQFISVERQTKQEVDKSTKVDDFVSRERNQVVETASREVPEKRLPFRPGKSELDDKPTPTDGQYDTTYRSDYTSKRISVDVSPTHNAFASSLRSVSPDRSKSPRISPEKRPSPERKSLSPTKTSDRFSSTETITKGYYRPEDRYRSSERTYSSDTISRRRKVEEARSTRSEDYNSDTITRRRKTCDSKTRSRSNSPTTTVSDFEYSSTRDVITTDLDEDTTRRPTSLELTSKKYKKVSEKSTSSPLPSPRKSPSPTKDTFTRRSSLKSPTKDTSDKPKDRPFRRRDTYEERCREILGIANVEKKSRLTQRDSSGSITSKTTTTKVEESRKSPTKERKTPSPTKPEPREFIVQTPERPQPTRKAPGGELPKPCKEKPQLEEFPAQIRKSPDKQLAEKYPEKQKPSKHKPQLDEFPAQIRKSPERQLLDKYPEKSKPTKESPQLQEFPAQIRKVCDKEPLEKYPEKSKPIKESQQLQEFPAQIKKTPEKEPLEKYPEKSKPCKEKPQLDEFPSQIRTSPSKEPLEKYPEKQPTFPDKFKPSKKRDSVEEFLTQERRDESQTVALEDISIRSSSKKTTQEETSKLIASEKQTCEMNDVVLSSSDEEILEPSSESVKPLESAPNEKKSPEFPGQARRSPERKSLEKPKSTKEEPSIQEFPAQIRKSPERKPLEKYPEKTKPGKEVPLIQEFPAQIRKSPEREPLEKYPEETKPAKEVPLIQEFPAQIRKSPEREPLEKYPEKTKPTKEAPLIQEFPAQIRKSPEREPLGKYPEKTKPTKEAPLIQEFPAQLRKSPERQPLEKYPEKVKPTKEAPSIQEFPSQIRQSPEREPLEKYPEKTKPTKEAPSVQEFPSQIRRSPERKPSEKYPEKSKPTKQSSTVQEFPAQVRKQPQRKPAEKYAETSKPSRDITQKSTQKEVTTNDEITVTETECRDDSVTRTETPKKAAPKVPAQARKPEKVLPAREKPKIKEFPAQVRTPTEKPVLEKPCEKEKPTKKAPAIKEFPAQRRKQETVTAEKRIPVEEPVFVKKFAYKLGEDDGDEERDVRHKTVKKDLSRDIEKERLKDKATTKTAVVKKNEINRTKGLVNGDIKQKPTERTIIRTSIDKKISKSPVTTLRKTDTSLTRRTISKTEVERTTPKRHIVTATITVSPKTTIIKGPTIHSVTTVKTTRTSPAKPTKKPQKLTNGHVSVSEESDTESAVEVTTTNKIEEKKTKVSQRTPQRSSKPDLYKPSPKSKPENKCVTTKSIVINNDITTEREIIVDLQRSKSSREPSPDRICPRPVSEDEDTGVPRYPDKVSEPDDGSLKRKPKRLSDIPILESETVTDFNTATEIKEESVEKDDSLLSVSDKVSKFITTAQKLTAPELQERPKSPRCQNYSKDTDLVDDNDESLLSVSEKISHFTSSAKDVSKSTSKFIETEKKIEVDKPVSLAKIDITPKRSSPIKETSPRRSASPKLTETPRSSRRPSDETRSILSSTSRLRSTESIRKAKALFENIGKDNETPKQRDILSRPSVFEARKLTEDVTSKQERECKVKTLTQKEEALKSARMVLDKIQRERSTSPTKNKPVDTDRVSPSKDVPEREVPGYMKPLDRSVKQHSPNRESVEALKKITGSLEDVRTTKFGVTLRRTDSRNSERRRSSQVSEKVEIEKEIEDIYDLQLLEEMLEKAVNYEIRRRIRSQIRVVKKLIEEGKLSSVIKTKTTITRTVAPEKKKTDSKVFSKEDVITRSSEYQSSYCYSERRTSSEFSRTTSRSVSPEVKPSTRTSPERKRPAEEKPEWLTKNILKKTNATKSSTITKTSRESKVRTRSPAKDTDIITSSYGVGPLDENGTPLFGLKALRAQNKQEKVKGTIVKSEYYSENGKEPVGEISVTKYSSDPKDLGSSENLKGKGVASVTTTQKFGYKDAPSLKSLTTDEDEIRTKATTTRRGSVKALSQKFIDNAVEASKNERQATYPKAGLILRSSSFKDGAKGDEKSELEETVTSKSSTTKAGSFSETFLTNKSKVTGVQDVINRMKNEDTRECETAEDAEARSLLNKFLGSQVLLSGMEGGVPKGARRTVTRITSTTTDENGKQKSVTLTFKHPIQAEDLEPISDERVLQLLLEQCQDYEDRRLVRARLRQVMAEQEASTDLVEKSGESKPSGAIEGESLLLPLLQGLLDAPENEQPADSGTESGEDMRSSLILEVQSALDKLSASLRSDSTDITPERRSSLLQLVTKLQAGLATQALSPTERRNSGYGRFASRKRSRQNRHTVGVSSEELADARRLMEEIAFRDNPSITPSTSASGITPSPSAAVLRKQNSESSVGQKSPSSFRSVSMNHKTAVKNAVAKPFSNSTSGTSSSVETPTDPNENVYFLFANDEPKVPEVTYTETAQVVLRPKTNIQQPNRPVSESISSDISSRKSVKDESESEDDTSVKTVQEPPRVPCYQPQPDVVLQANPIYSQPRSPEEKYNRFSSKKMKMKRANTIDIPKPLNFYECDDEEDEDDRTHSYMGLRGPIQVGAVTTEQKVPTFEPKTDSDKKFMAFLNKHNENHANRTALWTNKVNNWNNRFGNIRTTFENVSQPPSAKTFWKSADDAVTAGTISHQGPKISRQSARNLQQMFEEKQKLNEQKRVPWMDTKNVVSGSLRVDTNKGVAVFQQPPRFGAQSQPQSPIHKFPPQSPVRYSSQPESPVNKFSHAPMSAFRPIPRRQQSLDPLEEVVTKPASLNITKSTVVDNSDTPTFLYCPKPLDSPTESQTSSPITPTKSFLQPGERKSVNLAASKFEQAAYQSNNFQPRRTTQERGNVQARFLPEPTTPEKLTAPHLVRNVEQKSNAVRKLSNQFEAKSDPQPPLPQFSSVASVKYKTVTPQQAPQQNLKSNVPQKPHNYIPPTPKVVKSAPQPKLHQHHYVPQYNNKQQFVSPQTAPKPATANSQQFTSSYVYQPKQSERRSSQSSTISSQSKNVPSQNIIASSQPNNIAPQYNRQTSQDSYKEYNAAVTRVMTGPVGQTAVTVKQKSPMSRDEHDMERAFSLRSTLQKSTQRLSSGSFKTPYEQQKAASRTPSPRKIEIPPSLVLNGRSVESSQVNEDGVVTSKFHIPVVNVLPGTPTTVPSQAQVLSKSDSWHQICKQNQVPQPPQGPRQPVKSKSSHSLAVPKLFEAGMTKEEMLNKKRTMEAFFGGEKSPGSLSKSNSKENVPEKEINKNKSSINRIKTSEKVSIHRQATVGISRSRTLPDIVCPDMLDESNIDKAFDDLFKQKTVEEETTKKTTQSGPVTTTQVTTTKVTQQVTKKPISPFAKFKQLDKQNSTGSSPSTPKTPSGGAPLFKFTDPAVSQSATTIKERLLKWCQMKTREYENVKLENFSSSWADGLAFCALIHHFLPDAFDYSKLTPKERRHNFTLAFKVADEKADIAPLLDVDDMVACRKPDWKCVFTYVQSIYRRFKDED